MEAIRKVDGETKQTPCVGLEEPGPLMEGIYCRTVQFQEKSEYRPLESLFPDLSLNSKCLLSGCARLLCSFPSYRNVMIACRETLSFIILKNKNPVLEVAAHVDTAENVARAALKLAGELEDVFGSTWDMGVYTKDKARSAKLDLKFIRCVSLRKHPSGHVRVFVDDENEGEREL